jgi:Recombinase
MATDAMKAERKARTARAAARAADLAPTIKSIQAAGVTSLRGIAKALNERGISTASGEGQWRASQVRRVIRRIAAAA